MGILKGRCAPTALHSPAATFEYTIFKIPLDLRQVPDDRFSPFQIVPIRGIIGSSTCSATYHRRYDW